MENLVIESSRSGRDAALWGLSTLTPPKDLKGESLMTKPRIAVAGIHIESSTFTPYVSTADDFIVTRGEELMDRFYWRDEDWATQIEWIPRPARTSSARRCRRTRCLRRLEG